jgi:hypothetical protein
MGSEGITPPFLTSALDGGELSTSQSWRFILGAHFIGGYGGFRAGLVIMEKRKITCPYQRIESRLLGRPVLSLVAIPTELSRLP